MTILSEEIPFTNEAIKIYIKEAQKIINDLNKYVRESARLKTRVKVARKRLKDRG